MDGSCSGPLEGDRGNISTTGPSVEQNLKSIQAFVTYTHFGSKTDLSKLSLKGTSTIDLLEPRERNKCHTLKGDCIYSLQTF